MSDEARMITVNEAERQIAEILASLKQRGIRIESVEIGPDLSVRIEHLGNTDWA